MNTIQRAENAILPGTQGSGTKQRPPFRGKRSLFNVVAVKHDQSLTSDLVISGSFMLNMGEKVVVHTSKGPVLAEVCGIVHRKVLEKSRVKRIVRMATEKDLAAHAENKEKSRAAFVFCLKRIRAHNLSMKLCQVEYMLDSSRVLFYFSADHRIDFRLLVRELAHELDCRIEMRQIGIRDGAGLIGGIGPCGKDLCCSSFLRSFLTVSIRHAKDQGLTLKPTKVSGMCGRLMCCLVYEHATYKSNKSGAPRKNRRVDTALGHGFITEVDLLRRKVVVQFQQDNRRELFDFDEIVLLDPSQVPAQQAKSPASRPRREPRKEVSREVLQNEYMWDNAESEVSNPSDQSSAQKPKRRRRRRRRGPGNQQRTQQTGQKTTPNQDGAKASSNRDPGSPPPRRRRRRRRRKPRDQGNTGGSSNGSPPEKS